MMVDTPGIESNNLKPIEIKINELINTLDDALKPAEMGLVKTKETGQIR